MSAKGTPTVRVEGLWKKFCIDLRTSLRYGMYDLVGEAIGRSRSNTLRPKEFWAIKDVNFELYRGECLGLIGHNGAGKSTILRMLNGLMKPDQGRIEIRGRVGALIALGAGFNPILTGRENVFVNASVLGLDQAEIKRRFDSIVEFAEMEKFIDMPVQSYSSGMAARLGFSVACAVEPEVLLVDEVLAVGDQSFRLKAQRAIREAMRNGTTVIMVSHNFHDISGNATRCIWLDHGTVRMEGDTSLVSSAYMFDQTKAAGASNGALFEYSPNRKGHLVLERVMLTEDPSQHVQRVVVNDLSRPLEVELEYRAVTDVHDDVVKAFNLVAQGSAYIARSAFRTRVDVDAGGRMRERVRLQLPDLLPGRYRLENFTWLAGGDMLEGVLDLLEIEVEPAVSFANLTNKRPSLFLEKMSDNVKGSIPLDVEIIAQ